MLAASAAEVVSSQLIVNRPHDIAVQRITVPTDEEAIAHGKHLVDAVSACRFCHGRDLGGNQVVDLVRFQVATANLTAGEGGVGGTYSDEDWVRTLRHGVAPNGRRLLIMPSHRFSNLSEEDLGAVIAYVRSVPPVDRMIRESGRESPEREFTLAEPEIIPATRIDHEKPFSVAPEPGATAAYGEYLVSIAFCSYCHGEELSGRPYKPNYPALNLTPGGELSGWTEEDFVIALRNGLPPGQDQLNAEVMPWPHYGQMSGEELTAIFRYLQSLPARPNGY